MENFLEYVFLGLSNGAIYASIALAIVTLSKTMGQPNLSQGEMATFSTIIAWFLLNYMGLPYWGAFIATIGISFLWGALLEVVFYRAVEDEAPTSQFMVILGLFLMINGLSGLVFGFDAEYFPYPFEEGSSLFDNTYITNNEMFSLFVIATLVLATSAFYKYTKVGLALRAISQDQSSSSLMGINVSMMLMVNWGVSAAIGAVAGMLIAPVVYLEPNMMATVLIFALAGSILGGLTSPIGAVTGAMLVGLINALLVNYLDVVDRQLEIGATLLIVVVILLFKPTGLFVSATQKRV